MRVLHLVKTSVGADWACRQMRELVKLGIEVHVAAPGDGPLLPQYERAGVRVHEAQFDFPVSSPWRCPALFRSIRSLVGKIQPDLIHSHFVGTTLSMRLALGKDHPTPRIFQVPGPLHLEHYPYRWGEVLTAGRRDYWIGSCRWTCRRYRQMGISERRIFLAYYGGDLSRLARQPAGSLRRELGIGPETPLVGLVAYMYAPKTYLGQRRGLKGHEDLIDAIALLRREFSEILCVMIGTAPRGSEAYESRLKTYAAETCPGRIVFLGHRDDVPRLYPDLDVAVHPSHSDNVGGALESQILGIPTVATNVGGFPDAVKDGETGWLVPPRRADRLAESIADALRDRAKARRLSSKGQALAIKLLNVQRSAQDVSKAYNSILCENRGYTLGAPGRIQHMMGT